MYTRKNHLAMSAAEKQRFIAAVLALKADGTYDKLVREHRTAMPQMGSMPGMQMGSMSKMAHRNPWFLPWHRAFLLRFEEKLRQVDTRIALPYWNWYSDRAKASSLWKADFMGGSGQGANDHVASGPFAYANGHWAITVQSGMEQDPALRRALGRDSSLPRKSDIRDALQRTPYDETPWADPMDGEWGPAFRPTLEHQVHDPVHGWVGGTMELSTSPNDPVFFLHHANVDRLWTVWHHQNSGEARYLPHSGGGRFDQDKPMPVVGTTPAGVLNQHSLGYRYDVEDTI